jgi:nitroimidazol reductase NimA-like FMN-containing flavoprotein (pyridoxamine 5'-phosphate oxidase superfamily)
MTTPTGTIDTRYSEPGAVATPWEEVRRVLADAQLAWLSTVRPEGGPHVTPVVPVLVDETLYFMTGTEEQKARNIERNPKVALITGANTWDRGLDVVVEGTARMVTDDATLRGAAAAWGATWDGRWTLVSAPGGLRHMDEGEPEPYEIRVYAIDPTVAYGHAKGGFAHTRYTFER